MGDNPTTSDGPARLASEAREIYRALVRDRGPVPTDANRVAVPNIPFRFALKDRIERLCAALDVEDMNLTQDSKTTSDGPNYKDQYPGFTVFCESCGSRDVLLDNSLGWGSVNLVCQGCGASVEIVS